jgi:hypothetical protein
VKKKIVTLLVLLAACILYSPMTPAQTAAPQQPVAADNKSSQASMDQNIELLRQDIRSKKKQLIAANLKLTDSEATKFWPVYDQFTAELVKINDDKYALIKEYAGAWGTMTDAQAESLTKRALAVDEQVSQLRIRYLPLFQKVVPGKTVATFFQLDRRIQSMIDLQLAAQLPLVQAQE